MAIPEHIKERILEAVMKTGTQGTTISALQEAVGMERHTLSKYLSLLAREGFLMARKVSTAKVYTLDNAPLQTLSKAPMEHLSFTEKVLTRLIATMPLGMLVLDREYIIQFCNDSLRERYGDVQGRTFYESILGRPNPLGLKTLRTFINHGNVRPKSFLTRDRNRRILKVWVSQHVNPDMSRGVLLLMDDITERKETERRLKGSEELYRTLVETSPEAIVVSNLEGRFVMANRAAEALFCEPLRGKSCFEFLRGEEAEKARQTISGLLKGKNVRNRDYLLTVKKRHIPVEVNASLVRGADRKPLFLVGVVRTVAGREGPEKAVR